MAIAWIYLDDKGPIVYKQETNRLDETAYNCFKTSNYACTKRCSGLPLGSAKGCTCNEAWSIIKKFRIDELQLINVLEGHESYWPSS